MEKIKQLPHRVKQFASLENQNLNSTLFPKYLIHRAGKEKPPQDWAFWCSDRENGVLMGMSHVDFFYFIFLFFLFLKLY